VLGGGALLAVRRGRGVVVSRGVSDTRAGAAQRGGRAEAVGAVLAGDGRGDAGEVLEAERGVLLGVDLVDKVAVAPIRLAVGIVPGVGHADGHGAEGEDALHGW
jgi:hypothetical protein